MSATLATVLFDFVALKTVLTPNYTCCRFVVGLQEAVGLQQNTQQIETMQFRFRFVVDLQPITKQITVTNLYIERVT